MKQFGHDELSRFLAALDSHMVKPRDIILIGGAAASLAYGISKTTSDIDTLDSIANLKEAIRLAREETGLDIPFQEVGIWDAPYNYEDRLQSIEPRLQKLHILVPEKHDLTLMKVVRGQENDRDAIEQISNRVGLDMPTLVHRFTNEMTHAIGNHRYLVQNFLSIIEMLYGEHEADRVNSELANDSRWSGTPNQ
jgi:hypothetical protein